MPIDAPFVADRLRRAADTIAALAEQADAVARLTRAVRDALADGRTVLTCGNGGSAAEALHLAEELVGRYRDDRRPYPAVCLSADATAVTCIANDYGFDHVFERQVRALTRPGDVLVALSTSGASENIRRALAAARDRGATTIGLLGKTGGPCRELCDFPLVVDSPHTEHIQEAHLVVIHLILEAVEAAPIEPAR